MPRWPLAALLLFSIILFADNGEPVKYELNQDNGLPSNEVYEVLQDSFGYLWIGCDAGLFRYDGFEYKHYTARAQNSRSISDLFLDNKDRVWCRNFTGQIFRVDGDSLNVVYNLRNGQSTVFGYAVDSNYNLYVAAGNLISVYSENGDSLRRITVHSPGLQSYHVIRDIRIRTDKIFCAIPQIGIFSGSLTGNEVELLFEIKAEAKQTPLISFINGEKVHCVIASPSYTEIAEIKNDSFVPVYRIEHAYSGFRIHSVTPCYEFNGFFVSTNAGVQIISGTGKGYTLREHLFPDEKVSWVMCDREGTTWFTTLTSGIFAVPSLDVKMLSPGNSSLPEEHFTHIATDETGSVIAGSYTGKLYSVYGDTGIIEVADPGGYFIIAFKDALNTPYGMITARGTTIIHTPNGENIRIPVSNVRDLELIGDTLYLLYPEGLVIYDMQYVIAHRDLSMPNFVRKVGGRSMAYDPHDSTLYISFNDGVHSYKNGRMNSLVINGQTLYANDLCYSGVNVWAASVSQGVVSLVHGEVSEVYNSTNILHENEIRVVHAHGNTVFASSDKHLYVIDQTEVTARAYDVTHGIVPGDIAGITFQDTRLWLATSKGIVSFPYWMPAKNEIPPAIAITDVTLDGVVVNKQEVCELPNRNYNFVVNFTSVSLRSRGKYTVSYRIAETDTSWNVIPASVRSISYSGLQPGEYTLEIKATNEHGVSSPVPATLRIFVPTPLWQTWWFYLLSAVAIISVVAFLFMLRIRSLRRKAEMKNKLVMSQLTALKAQMNPHFMYNALNSIQDLVLQHDVRNSSLYLSKFSQLMRAVLDGSGKEEIRVEDEYNMLSLYLELEKLRMGEDFSFAINVPEGITGMRLPSMIIQPFVENALKHGLLHKKGAKSLTIDFAVMGEELQCTITDNGVGRKRSEEINTRQRPKHRSFATDATDKRVELINESGSKRCEIEISDLSDGEHATGTKVVLRFTDRT